MGAEQRSPFYGGLATGPKCGSPRCQEVEILGVPSEIHGKWRPRPAPWGPTQVAPMGWRAPSTGAFGMSQQKGDMPFDEFESSPCRFRESTEGPMWRRWVGVQVPPETRPRTVVVARPSWRAGRESIGPRQRWNQRLGESQRAVEVWIRRLPWTPRRQSPHSRCTRCVRLSSSGALCGQGSSCRGSCEVLFLSVTDRELALRELPCFRFAVRRAFGC